MDSSTVYRMRSFLSRRFDHICGIPFNGSGPPVPVYGCSDNSINKFSISLMTFLFLDLWIFQIRLCVFYELYRILSHILWMSFIFTVLPSLMFSRPFFMDSKSDLVRFSSSSVATLIMMGRAFLLTTKMVSFSAKSKYFF